MVNQAAAISVRLIPIERIVVENPRERSEKTFKQLVESISKVGLKKPITVTERSGNDGRAILCG